MKSTTSPALTEAVVRDALTRVYDPEFGVSVEDLGLIYEVGITGGHVAIALTLTSMYCPAGSVIMDGVRAAVAALPGVSDVEVVLIWEPSWTPERLSASAREQLGWSADGAGGH
jgi:metal-sulfur cluster biosynthetic enzyme